MELRDGNETARDGARPCGPDKSLIRDGRADSGDHAERLAALPEGPGRTHIAILEHLNGKTVDSMERLATNNIRPN
jgi:hypothetical protein